MSWLNGTGTRSSFSGPMAPLLGIHEDCVIAQNTRYSIFKGEDQGMDVHRTAGLRFKQNLAHIASLVVGTTDGSTPISSAKKQALVKLMLQPSMQ